MSRQASKLDDVTPPGYIKPKKISEGAFGQVLKVLHEQSGIEYAVKVLPMLKEGDKERVSREVEMLTRFAHPRIVRLHESIDMGGHHAIVMELGTRSLKDLISEYEERKELIPLPLTVMILSDICEGLLWMHTHSSGSTAHGDLKPENVLLRINNRAFLCDLGGSALLDQQLTSTIRELGTFEYNSPERVMDSNGLATPASDVWSLGVLAYRMVTGRPLFEGLTLPQLCIILSQFNEARITTTIPSQIREVLLKMFEPNVALRATTSALLEGGLLERMLGAETDLSKMKSIQLATGVNEIKESLNDAEVEERTMKLELEKEKLLLETQELEGRLRSLQMSLQRTRSRNTELEKEEKLEQRQHLITTQTTPISINPEDNILSTSHEMPALQFYIDENFDDRLNFDVSGNTITRTGFDLSQFWTTTLFEEPISEGVVSVAITVLAIPKANNSKEGLMFGLVDALSTKIGLEEQLGENVPSSIALASQNGSLHLVLPSTKQEEKTISLSAPLSEGDRVVLEVDMDARPRTAVFILNGSVLLTFVSSLPPSIRFGFSMKREGTSVRFDGMSRLVQATPLRRVNEIKWNAKDMRDSEDMYMNGMRSSVLSVQTQMPSLIFTDPSHFRVDDNRIISACLRTKDNDGQLNHTYSSFFLGEPISEGILAISFTCLISSIWQDFSLFGLIDGTTPFPENGQKLGEVSGSIAMISWGSIRLLTSTGQQEILLPFKVKQHDSLIIEINMDSNPRSAQFFFQGKSTNILVVGLPESVRVGFSAKGPGTQVRFDRITNLNRATPFTDLMKEIEWPTAESLQVTELKQDSDGNDEERVSQTEERNEKDSFNNASDINKVDDRAVDDQEDADGNLDHPPERMMRKVRDEEASDGASDSFTDEEMRQVERDGDKADDKTGAKQKKRQFTMMKLPELLFADKSHFTIRNNILTRTEKGTDEKGRTRPSTVLFAEPITKGVVSVTFVVLTLAKSVEQKGVITFGLLDSFAAVPRPGRVLGKNVKHSVGFSSRGRLRVFNQTHLEEGYCRISREDRVVMEVNMDSTPRTVQFFVNGKSLECYVSGIPESVRIGFSAHVMGTSLQITSIIHSTQSTPLAEKILEIKWTDTEESLRERYSNHYKPIRREGEEGLMHALVSRNPEHFHIEGNVITRTAFDFNGLDTPFSTVMFDGVLENMVFYVQITILALPQTDSSCGVVMIGGMSFPRRIPKSPNPLGIQKKGSYALCSSDGLVHRIYYDDSTSTQTLPPLQVGDQVILEVNTLSKRRSRFFLNGQAGLNVVSEIDKLQLIGYRDKELTFQDKSTLFYSLVALVKANYPFNETLQDRAFWFLKSLKPEWGDEDFSSKLFTLFRIGPFHAPTSEYILASPIMMTLSNCLMFAELSPSFLYALSQMKYFLEKWKEEGPEVTKTVKRMMEALFSEGFEDTLEQMKRNNKDGQYGFTVAYYCHSISQLLGSNVELLE
ncbi:putative serine/threonine protein kinase [Blattamonas nauphoetae]|uniref:non-specific serine/threonine protein kinase n=1 Tax=Blattamonas nauphoetae TaxID=2049346 RepID=A0ABQ9X109_9EUKA|nr:putative serine/threonine protein kinase [Blattamonas nauphoetae]